MKLTQGRWQNHVTSKPGYKSAHSVCGLPSSSLPLTTSSSMALTRGTNKATSSQNKGPASRRSINKAAKAGKTAAANKQASVASNGLKTPSRPRTSKTVERSPARFSLGGGVLHIQGKLFSIISLNADRILWRELAETESDPGNAMPGAGKKKANAGQPESNPCTFPFDALL